MRLFPTRFATLLLLLTAFLSEISAQNQSTVSTAPNSSNPSGTSAAELGLVELKNDLSRQELFSEIRRADIDANSGRI